MYKNELVSLEMMASCMFQKLVFLFRKMNTDQCYNPFDALMVSRGYKKNIISQSNAV